MIFRCYVEDEYVYPACKAEIADVGQDLSKNALPYSHAYLSSVSWNVFNVFVKLH